MATTIVTTSSVAAPAEDVWKWAITPAGINDELGPYMRMTVPRHVRGKSIEDFEIGQKVCRSWFLLFGAIPFDYDDIGIAEVGPGFRFVESSTMLSIRAWRHERRVVPTEDGCEVTDDVSFVLRRPSAWIPGMRLVVRAFLAFLFRHRHRRLAAHFDAARGTTTTPKVLQTAT